MEQRKQKLLEQKKNLEDRVNKFQNKLRIINQELKSIELQEKSKSVDEIVNLLKQKGISDVENINDFIELIKCGKITIK